MKKLAIFFPLYPLEPVHMKKDPGLFSYAFLSSYFDEVEIVTIPGNEPVITGSSSFKIRYLYKPDSLLYRICSCSGKLRQCSIAVLSYLYVIRHHAITHVMTYHSTLYSFVFLFLLEHFSKKIKTYLRFDISVKGINELLSIIHSPKKAWFYLSVLSKTDLLSVETSRAYSLLSSDPLLSRCNLHSIPNGLPDESFRQCNSVREKTIMTVSRLGSYPKHTELLLDILSDLDLHDWHVKLIGPCCTEDGDFSVFLDSFFRKYPVLQAKTELPGNISDPELLRKEYAKASVFLFTSRFESFGIAPLEAAAQGDYIISTDVGCIYDITDKGNLGFICSHSGENNQNYEIIRKETAEHLQKIINGSFDIGTLHQKQSDFVRNTYSMDSIINLPCFKEWAGN